MDLSLLDPSKGLVVLSHGMGQDSHAILQLLTDPDRPKLYADYVGDRNLVVLHSDTGNEHAATVEFRKWTSAFCAARGIYYAMVEPSMGYHRGGWTGGLIGQWESNSTVGSVAFPSTCSDQLKISPLYLYLGDMLRALYGFRGTRKQEFYEYVERFGEKMTVLIGYARGEESRAGVVVAESLTQLSLIDTLLPKAEADAPRCLWMERNIVKRFPLLDVGYDRLDLQAYLKGRELPCPPPSLCSRCHWKGRAHIEAMRRFTPDELDAWIENERVKVEAWRERCATSGARNSYVKGSISLSEFEAQAHDEFGHYSDDELREHIFSHGHAMKTRH